MNDSVDLKAVSGLDDLEKTAREAAEMSSKASGHSAVWDKALKALKPGLTDLDKVRAEAKKEAEATHKLIDDLDAQYDGEASNIVRTTRDSVDAEIKNLRDGMSASEQALVQAKSAAADAQQALDASKANFDQAQNNLQGLSKEIQQMQKDLVALKAEVNDAHGKHQLVEAVVKLEDLKKMLAAFNETIKPEHTAALWTKLDSAVRDLLDKTDKLPAAQAKVSQAEAAFKAAKAQYDDAQKNRLDTIKQQVADKDPAHAAAAAS
jgi:chromosome segregation ATPase